MGRTSGYDARIRPNFKGLFVFDFTHLTPQLYPYHQNTQFSIHPPPLMLCGCDTISYLKTSRYLMLAALSVLCYEPSITSPDSNTVVLA